MGLGLSEFLLEERAERKGEWNFQSMPVSNYLQISPIMDKIVNLHPSTMLDVGCGLGIYGALSRVFLEEDNLYDRTDPPWNKKENWNVKIDGIEGFEKYITDLHRHVYNDILIGNALEIFGGLKERSYDLVIAIDILEHFEKEEGIRFIRELQRIGRTILVATPATFIEQIEPINPLEDHRSLWTKEDLLALGFDLIGETVSLIGIYSSPAQTSPVSETAPVIRMYQEGDEYGITALFREVFGREMPIDEWKWKYKGQGNRRVCAVVIDLPGKGIIGHYGGIPFRMTREGVEIKGISACDVMIKKKHRSFTHLKKMHNLFVDELFKDSFIMFYGFPTEHTLTLPAEKLKLYERVEPVYDAVKDTAFNNNTTRFLYKLFPMSFDDDAIDRLWNDVGHEFRLSIIRDKTYLKWRYEESRLFRYELWGLRRRWSKRLDALAVLRRDGTEKLYIIDMVFGKKVLPSLLSKAENLACSLGMKKLSLWMPQRFHQVLLESGFSFLPFGTTLPRSTHPLTIKKEEIAEKFFYTMGDTDFL